MSEPFVRTRPGPGGYAAPAQRTNAGGFDRDNPLAELARLVGKDDPFRDAGQSQERSASVARFPQLAAPTPPAMPEHVADQTQFDGPEEPYEEDAREPARDLDADLRGSLEEHQAEESRPRDSLRFPVVQTAQPMFDPVQPQDFARPDPQREAPPLNADLWAEGAMPQGSFEQGSYEGPVADDEHANAGAPRRTLIVLVAVLALTCGGLGATFLMREGSHLGSGGKPPTIMADEAPVKVQSPDMANDGSADANTALLEKTGSNKVDNAKVVTNQEQPVDLGQLPKGAVAHADAASALAAGSASPFPEPRKVKTILIRPDGSVVGEAPPKQADPPVMPGVAMPVIAADGAAATQPQPRAPAAALAKPSTPKSTARVSATPKTVDGSANTGASGAKQTAAPTHAPKPKPNVAVADADTATDTAPAATPGTYSVQMAAPGSEQEAKDTATRLQKKYSDELGSLKPSIHKADTGSKSVYRVRVSNLSQDDAKSLCSKLQSSGGSCFVVRN